MKQHEKESSDRHPYNGTGVFSVLQVGGLDHLVVDDESDHRRDGQDNRGLHVRSKGTVNNELKISESELQGGGRTYFGGSPNSCIIKAPNIGVGNKAPKAEAIPASTKTLL